MRMSDVKKICLLSVSNWFCIIIQDSIFDVEMNAKEHLPCLD